MNEPRSTTAPVLYLSLMPTCFNFSWSHLCIEQQKDLYLCWKTGASCNMGHLAIADSSATKLTLHNNNNICTCYPIPLVVIEAYTVAMAAKALHKQYF